MTVSLLRANTGETGWRWLAMTEGALGCNWGTPSADPRTNRSCRASASPYFISTTSDLRCRRARTKLPMAESEYAYGLLSRALSGTSGLSSPLGPSHGGSSLPSCSTGERSGDEHSGRHTRPVDAERTSELPRVQQTGPTLRSMRTSFGVRLALVTIGRVRPRRRVCAAPRFSLVDDPRDAPSLVVWWNLWTKIVLHHPDNPSNHS